MDLGLTGCRAAVAAASGGLGFAAARALVLEGAAVAVCGRDRERIETAARGLGGETHPVVADVGTAEGAASFVQAAQDALGGVDILVTNAGGPPPTTFAAAGLDAYEKALELNLLSVVRMCKAAVPPMRERGWGRVVAITSVTVRQPKDNLILSTTARAGASGFLKSLALEVARDGVTVNSIQPGSHATDRLRALQGGDLDSVAAQLPVGRVGAPEDFGSCVAFLCSRQAGFITGAALPVDGGEYGGLL